MKTFVKKINEYMKNQMKWNGECENKRNTSTYTNKKMMNKKYCEKKSGDFSRGVIIHTHFWIVIRAASIHLWPRVCVDHSFDLCVWDTVQLCAHHIFLFIIFLFVYVLVFLLFSHSPFHFIWFFMYSFIFFTNVFIYIHFFFFFFLFVSFFVSFKKY
jgi:hypothetical protein